MLFPQRHETLWISTIFRRTGPSANDYDRIKAIRLRGQDCFDTDLVPPVVGEVVLIQKAFIHAEMEVHQPDLVWVIVKPNASELDDAVLFPMDPESVEVAIGPPHGDLEKEVKVGDGAIASDQQTAPNHWAYAQQRCL
jgi:hypothetical protein